MKTPDASDTLTRQEKFLLVEVKKKQEITEMFKVAKKSMAGSEWKVCKLMAFFALVFTQLFAISYGDGDKAFPLALAMSWVLFGVLTMYDVMHIQTNKRIDAILVLLEVNGTIKEEKITD